MTSTPNEKATFYVDDLNLVYAATAAPTPTPTPTDVPGGPCVAVPPLVDAQESVVIYDNAMQNGWLGDNVLNFSNIVRTAPSAIAVALVQRNALRLYHAPFLSSAYASVE